MNDKQKGLMKGVTKVGIIFSAILVATFFVFYILPAFATPGVTPVLNASTPGNASNVSTAGTVGYFYVNISSNESFLEPANLTVYNLTGNLARAQFSMTNSTSNPLANYSFFNVTGLANGTFQWMVTFNTTSLGANQTFGNFTVTLGQIYNAVITNPANSTNTANDLTPEIRVSANSTFLTNMSLTLYTNKAGTIQSIINTTITNGTETYFNLTQLSEGTYNVIAELGNSADFKVNSTALTIVVTLLEANATANVASVNAGARQNYTFTIANNGTDTIDRINISYDVGYADPVAGDIVCPTTTSLWNRSVDGAVNSVICLLPGPTDTGITTGTSKTIKVENWSAPNDARVKTFDVAVRGLKGGTFTIVSSKPSTSVFGNLSINGTDRAASVNQTGTTNLTIISFNLSATGEQMNISEIIVTRNGTVTDSDIVQVKIYNSTRDSAGASYNDTLAYDIIAVNTSAPTNGRYNFSGLSLKVNASQIIIVVVNLSSTAVGGRTMNFSIEGASDVATVGANSGQAITETLTTTRSSTTTIYGTLSVTGTNSVNGTTNLGANRTTFVSYNLSAVGEAMNVSEILFTINGTGVSTANVQSISLFNSTDPSTTIVNGSQTLIRTNVSATGTPTSVTYNLSGLNLSVPTGATGQIVLISLNISGAGTAGNSVNITIRNNADIVTVSSVSGQNIAETLTTAGSSTTRLFGSMTIVGGSRVTSTTQIGSKNVTVITFNFTAAGEQMNITGINVTLNGTILMGDIDRVALYNTSLPNAALFNGTGTWDIVAWNNSAPNISVGVNTLRYNFSNIVFNVPSGATNILAVVINLTDTAKGGRIFNASIEGAADVNTTGGGSAVAIVESISGQRSGSSTIYGNLSVTGTNIAPSAADVGQIGVGLLRLTLNATGEIINVTSINVTSNSTRNQDILSVRLFNDTGGVTLGTYERGVDLPVSGASGVFTGSSVILTPTAPIQIENNTLVYVYVAVDVNTSATTGPGRLAVSVQSAGGISAVGNESLVSLTPQLITGDPGGSAPIRNLTATSTVIVTSTAVARVEAGKSNNYTFTINNTGTGSLVDSIDEIRINFVDAGFTLAGNVTCPTIGSTIAWNRTILSANTIVCNVTDTGGVLAADKNTTIAVENFTAGQTAGLQAFNITVRGAVGGLFNVTTSKPTVTVYGNLTIIGTNRVNATTTVGINRITFISYNLSASGEAANVSELVITVNGSSISSADIQSITLFNSTDPSTTIVNGSQTLMMTNVSSTNTPTSLTFNFSRLNLSVPTGATGQIVLVVVNVSSNATGGHTMNATLLNTANVVTIGSLTGVGIAANLTTQASSSTTVIGNLSIVGTSRVAATTGIGTGNVTVISFNFTATGESMNISGINVTFNGTFTNADITRVGLYNSTAAAAGLLDGSGVNYDLIQWNTSAPVNGRFNFSNIGFNVSAGTTNVLLVVINVSSGATGGNTFNVSIEGAADVNTTSGITAQPITESFATQRSSSSSFSGTLSVTGTSRVASWTRLGSSNVTIISYNFSATGEQMNISEIIVTRNGTVTNADIVEVKLYNSTRTDAGVFNGTPAYDPIATNTSAPTNGRYNFSGLSFKVPSSQIVLVVFNISSGATAGNTFNASIEGIADIATIGGATGAVINETFVTQRSGTSTLVALNVSANSIAPGNVSAGQTSVGMLNITFTATGETMNVTSLNVTLTGNGTSSNITEIRVYRDDAAPLGAFTTADTYLTATFGVFNGATIQINMTPNNYNVSLPTSAVTFFVTYNISSNAVRGSTVGAQLVPSGIAAIGNASGLAISVTGNTVASANATIQLQSNVVVGAVTASVTWITNRTTGTNSTAITIPVNNSGQATANLTSVLVTLLNAFSAENASTNFTIVRADSVTSIAGGVSTTLNFTINSTTPSQLAGLVNVSVRLLFNDSNTLAASNNTNVEKNTTGLFGLDGFLPVITMLNPSNGATNVNGTIDINFTLNDTGSGVNSSSLVLLVNGVSKTATCNPTQLNFTCNFSLTPSDSAYIYATNIVTVNVTDNATNAATRGEINFTVVTTGAANITVLVGGGSTYPLGWNTLWIPFQGLIESTGRNATTTGSFNFTSILNSLGNSWNYMYYNINGTSTGWVLATRTDPGGSTLKYVNNTNDKPYWINMTVTGAKLVL